LHWIVHGLLVKKSYPIPEIREMAQSTYRNEAGISIMIAYQAFMRVHQFDVEQ
jgi:hypothetical protein